MYLDPRRLRVLLAVARSGGVLAAADELSVTPSAVSQQLTRLEREVGRALIERTPRGAVLTAAGRTLSEAAEDVERTLNLASARLSHDEAQLEGTFRVGGFQSFLCAVLIPQLTPWREQFPGLRFQVTEDDEEGLMRALRAGELDAVIVERDAGEPSGSLPSGMTEAPLLDEPWKLVVPSGTLRRGELVDLARLHLSWLGVDPTVASAQAVRRALGSGAPTSHHYQVTQTALALVAAGEGVAFIPSLALRGVPQEGVETVDVPGIGTRRIVLRRYERKGTPEASDVAAGLIREAAATFDFAVEPSE